MDTASHIRNIIFDLGGVLLNIEPVRTGEALTRMGVANMKAVHEHLLDIRLYDRYDSGRCSDTGFREEVRQACGIALTDEQVDMAWNALLLDFPEARAKMLHEIRGYYRVYLLSNTNAIHFRSYTAAFRERYGEELPDLFDQLFLSYELGCHKPDPEIFEKVLALGGFKPEETLFIDDSLANAVAATRSGMVAIHLAEGMEVSGLFKNGKLRSDAEFLIP